MYNSNWKQPRPVTEWQKNTMHASSDSSGSIDRILVLITLCKQVLPYGSFSRSDKNKHFFEWIFFSFFCIFHLQDDIWLFT